MSLKAFAEISSGKSPVYRLQEVGGSHHETNSFSQEK